MNIRRFVWATVLVCSATPVLAQQRDSLLDALVQEALVQNPTVAQRQAAARAAMLRIRPAGALPDPMLTAGVMDLVLPRFAFNQSDFTELDAELSQNFPWPGSLGARAGAAKATAAGAQAEEQATRREITAMMADAYYRLQYAVSALASLRHQLTLLDAAVQLSTTRYGTGSAPQSDPLQAKLARDRLQLETLSAESERVSTLAAVNALRNHAPDDAFPVVPIDVAAVRAGATPPPSTDSLVAAAVATHPRLAARHAALDEAARMIQVERLGGRPDFTLILRYGYRPRSFNFNPPDFFSASVGVRLPLWAGRKQHRLTDAARADYVAASAELRDTELQLGRDVTETAARVAAAQQRLALLVDHVVPAAQGTVESVLRSYQVGRAEFLTLLSVEDARYRAELEAAEVAAYYQTQLVRLRQLTAEESRP